MKRLPIPILFLFLLVSSLPLLAAEPPAPIPDPGLQQPLKIAVPAGPIGAGVAVQLPIQGLEPKDLPMARVSVWPREKVTLVAARPWGDGDPFVWFVAQLEGEYLLQVMCPRDGGLCYCEAVLTVGKPGPKPDPEPVNPYHPAKQYQALMGGIQKLRLSRSDATNLALFCGGLSKIVLQGIAPTTGALRAKIVEGALPDFKGKYPGLADAFESVMTQTLGLENIPLNKSEAAQLLETMAWAVWETGKT